MSRFAPASAFASAFAPAFAFAFAFAVAAAGGLAAGPAFAQAVERCYGVAPAGANDGIAPAGANDGIALAGADDGLDEAEDPGSSTVDFQGDAWTWVPAGRCLTLPLPARPDGTPRRGAYQPLDRDRS